MHLRASHKKMLSMLRNSKNWIEIDKGSIATDTNKNIRGLDKLKKRYLYTFKYVSDNYKDKKHLNIYIKYSKDREDIILDQLIKVYNKYKDIYFIVLYTNIKIKRSVTNKVEQFAINKGLQQETVLSKNKIIVDRTKKCNITLE